MSPSSTTADALVLIDESQAPVYLVTINRAHVKNAVDRPTARQLHAAFVRFAQDDRFAVAILRGAGRTFCAGADLTAAFDELSTVRGGATKTQGSRSNDLFDDMSMPGPMGLSRMALPKPVIACIEGYALAGGLELAAWCDMRVASRTATLGLPCRTRGVPLIDGGTVRYIACYGSDLDRVSMETSGYVYPLLTLRFRRHISAAEALQMGLVNRVVAEDDPDATLRASMELARLIASKPQLCMQHDRLSVMGHPISERIASNAAAAQPSTTDVETCPFAVQGTLRSAMALEFQHGLISLTALGGALEDFVRRKSKL